MEQLNQATTNSGAPMTQVGRGGPFSTAAERSADMFRPCRELRDGRSARPPWKYWSGTWLSTGSGTCLSTVSGYRLGIPSRRARTSCVWRRNSDGQLKDVAEGSVAGAASSLERLLRV